MAELSDRQLVESARHGDVESFTALCGRYYPAMVAIAHAILSDRHLAEDAAQESFAKAAVKLSQLKDMNQFASWLGAICRNVAKDMLRAAGRIHTSDDLSGVADTRGEDGQVEAVRKAIEQLPTKDRELIFLRYYDGMTYKQISAVLGISEQAINGRLRRAKKSLAKTLKRDISVEVTL